ncbi:unnamed protein product [Caenorhabditis nigoni]
MFPFCSGLPIIILTADLGLVYTPYTHNSDINSSITEHQGSPSTIGILWFLVVNSFHLVSKEESRIRS